MTENEFLKMRDLASKKFDLNNIDPAFIANLVFNSLSFEKRFINFEEVSNVLNDETEGIDENKALLIINHKKAFMFMVDLVKNKEDLTESKLKDCHAILLNDNGGLYRNVDIAIQGSNHTPPSHLKVYDRMKRYFEAINNPKGDAFDHIAFSHLQLAKIHPFLDGNGRLARLVLNYHIMKYGLSPIIIPVTEKERYFDCLEQYKVNKDINQFIEYLVELENRCLS